MNDFLLEVPKEEKSKERFGPKLQHPWALNWLAIVLALITDI